MIRVLFVVSDGENLVFSNAIPKTLSDMFLVPGAFRTGGLAGGQAGRRAGGPNSLAISIFHRFFVFVSIIFTLIRMDPLDTQSKKKKDES